jgi:hypothetical protein
LRKCHRKTSNRRALTAQHPVFIPLNLNRD